MVSAAAFSHNLIGLLIPFENNAFLLVFLLFALLLNFAYLGLAIKFGRQFMDKLFGHGSNVDWALYSIWTLFTYGIFLMHRHMPGSHALHIALWLFIPWTIALICYLVIAIHRRMRLEHEHALAREILSSGRAYYDKLTSMTEHLRHLHHDYKHQLNSIQKMLETDHSEDVQEYLIKLNAATKNDIIYNYCNNQVLNALLSSFAERCEREGISFSVKIILPSSETIDNYELCIIIGNLLENALSACIRTPEGRKRYIDLSMRPREDNYGIKVENSYDGVLKHEDKQLFSTKKNGGFGIKSIKSVTKRHSGEYIPVWDDEKFSAFVLLKQCDSLLA
jgi:signal transduction histidine kinase